MSTYTHQHRVQGPFVDYDPVHALIQFFRANGYSVVQTEDGPRPAGLERKVEDEEHKDDIDPGTDAPAGESDPEPDSEAIDAVENSDEVESSDGEDEADESEGESESESESDESPPEPELQDGDGENDESAPEIAESELQDAPDTVAVSATLVRGEKGASIWTSNMTELFATVRLTLSENAVTIAHEVETTMQHFTDDDRAFWTKESRKADSYVTGKVDAIIDWRENESIRADQVQRDIVVFGIQMMVFAAIFTAIVYFAFFA